MSLCVLDATRHDAPIMTDAKSTLVDEAGDALICLQKTNAEFLRSYPGDPAGRQAIHTVYGGAHLFKAETPSKLGQLAVRSLDTYAPDALTLGRALGLPGSDSLASTVYSRVRAKLEREPIEDFRIDFEDGFGVRPDAEEDQVAIASATELARAMADNNVPPFIGIRIKPLNEELRARSVRTLDLFVSTLVAAAKRLPDNFVVTLPKVQHPGQVTAVVRLFEKLERRVGLSTGAIKLELMIEVTQAIIDHDGHSTLPRLLQAAEGRCVAAHFGTYDYTASCNITAAHQRMDHPACDFALHMMKVAFAGRGVFLSDGATTVMPIGPHRPEKGATLSSQQEEQNAQAVHRAWKLAYDNIRHSLINGIYQGWDLHPGQLPIRYAACYAFFLEGFDAAAERLRNFIEKAAQATLVGDVFDDAATGQGLLNYFLRGLNSGAVSLEELATTGLTKEEVATRSFVKILAGRAQAKR